MTTRTFQKTEFGFTAVELLAVIAVMAVLAGMLLPASANARTRSRTMICRENLRQLTRAWQVYGEQNGGALPASLRGATRPAWVEGNLDFSTSDSTNRQYLANSPLFRYVGSNYQTYQCPSDRSVKEQLPQAPRFTPRTRSYSMSQAFDSGVWLPSPPYRTYANTSDLVDPANTMVFVDEHPDSINDGSFALAMAEPNAVSGSIIDFPAAHHAGAGGFSFSDGHTEFHKWIGSTIKPPVRYKGTLALNVPARDSLVDLKWMSQKTTVRQ